MPIVRTTDFNGRSEQTQADLGTLDDGKLSRAAWKLQHFFSVVPSIRRRHDLRLDFDFRERRDIQHERIGPGIAEVNLVFRGLDQPRELALE